MQEELIKRARVLPRTAFVAQHPQAFFVYGMGATGFKTGYFPPVPARDARPESTMRVPTVGAVMLKAEGAARGILEVAKSERNLMVDAISIGRAPTCDIFLPDTSVSKVHAHFLREPSGKWVIRDAESTNGTFVNGVRAVADSKVQLSFGATVRLAHCEGRFLDADHLFDLLNGIRLH